jgi:hypothetical protein
MSVYMIVRTYFHYAFHPLLYWFFASRLTPDALRFRAIFLYSPYTLNPMLLALCSMLFVHP